MSKKVIFILTLFLGVNFTSYAQGEYNFPIDKHDFGVIEEGEIASYSFEFTNSGAEPLNLRKDKVRPSCGCTTPKVTEGMIAPGAKGVITAEYNSLGRPGTFTKTIHIFDSTNIVKTLTIKGIVIKKDSVKTPTEAELKKASKLFVEKTDHNFGKIERAQVVTQKFPIKNTGKDTLKITSAQSACSCINYKLYNAKDNTVITYILPGKTVNLELTYTPPATGHNRDIITLYTNDPTKRRLAFVLTANVVESLIEKSPVKTNDAGSPFQK